MDKKEFIIKGNIDSKVLYFTGFENRIIRGTEYNVKKYSVASIKSLIT